MHLHVDRFGFYLSSASSITFRSIKYTHCNGSGYKESRDDGYMHVCSYCSGTGRRIVLTHKYEIKKGQSDAEEGLLLCRWDIHPLISAGSRGSDDQRRRTLSGRH